MSADRDNLEDWLREHPEANDDLADLPQLRELYQSASPPEPDEAAWNAVCSRIHEIHRFARNDKSLATRRLWWAIAAASVAAAILAVLLARSLWTTSVPVTVPPTIQVAEEPFPVVDSEDVIILSMDARNVAALVVGEPPVGDDLEFARPKDIHVIRCERCPFSGRSARLAQGDEVPMFVTAAAVEPGNED
jgi:hypothetical protein